MNEKLRETPSAFNLISHDRYKYKISKSFILFIKGEYIEFDVFEHI